MLVTRLSPNTSFGVLVGVVAGDVDELEPHAATVIANAISHRMTIFGVFMLLSFLVKVMFLLKEQARGKGEDPDPLSNSSLSAEICSSLGRLLRTTRTCRSLPAVLRDTEH